MKKELKEDKETVDEQLVKKLCLDKKPTFS